MIISKKIIRFAVVAGLSFLFIFLNCLGTGNKYHSIRPPEKNIIRVCTYNINFGMSAPVECINAITTANAHIVLLQETTRYWEGYIRKKLSLQYPYMVFKHYRGAGGLAILSRFPLTDKKYIVAKHGWFPGWITEVNTPSGKISFLNVHLHPPLNEKGSIGFLGSAYFATKDIRQQEISHFFGSLGAETPAIVVGDFNEDESGSAVNYVRAKGFTNALPLYDSSGYTWRWPLRYYTLENRFDHILFTRHFRCSYAHVLHLGGSDHFPVVADLAFE
ncbi:MAG: hypothetical protein GY754_07875 [bacterium]|nr:hypothetical protein [bacterium]